MKTKNEILATGYKVAGKQKTIQAYTLKFVKSNSLDSILLESGTFSQKLRKTRFPNFSYNGRCGHYSFYKCSLNHSSFILTVQNL